MLRWDGNFNSLVTQVRADRHAKHEHFSAHPGESTGDNPLQFLVCHALQQHPTTEEVPGSLTTSAELQSSQSPGSGRERSAGPEANPAHSRRGGGTRCQTSATAAPRSGAAVAPPMPLPRPAACRGSTAAATHSSYVILQSVGRFGRYAFIPNRLLWRSITYDDSS